MVTFGVATNENIDYDTLRRMWLEAERLGFDSAWLCDHLTLGGYCLEAWTALSALSAETRHIRFGPMVLCNGFRNPAILAKMAASLDVISKGRLELGMGAGWYEPEYHAYNIPYPRTYARIRELREAVALIRKIWMEDKTTFQGKYYAVKDLVLDPKPVQKPHPRIWIGGFGEKFLLRTVAKLADGYILRRGATLEEWIHKMDVLKEHCKVVGRDFAEIRRAWVGPVFIGKTREEALFKLRTQTHPFRSRDKTPEHFAEESVVGTPAECAQNMRKYIDAGATDFIASFAGEELRDLKGLRLFEQAMSILRGK